jgi:DNA-binding CsgD family transcriptional regulator
MGLYIDDWERLGMLEAQSLLAGRLVTDTGIHAFGWSRERAVTTLREIGVPEVDPEIEIDRARGIPAERWAPRHGGDCWLDVKGVVAYNLTPMNRTSLSPQPASASLVESLRVVGSFDALRDLIQQLSAGWDDLNEHEKVSLLREIERRSGDLVHRSTLRIVPKAASAANGHAKPTNDVLLSKLTWRELQTLAALTEGRSTPEIAERFGICEATVRSHVKNILAKLGVHSRLEAVALAQSRISMRRARRIS